MRYGSLFGGIRTACYAAALLDWECVFNSENEKFPLRIGQQHGYGGEEIGDIETASFTKFAGMVDLLVGGFPCQDISIAGGMAGIDGARSRLWRHYCRAIKEVLPRFIVIENSSNLTRKGLDRILCDLADIGYDAEWECFSAAEFGACHHRNRIWILAYPSGFRRSGILRLLKGVCARRFKKKEQQELASTRSHFERFAERYGEPAVFGKYDGLTKRLHVTARLKACGNAMFWPIPYMIFKFTEEAISMTDDQWFIINKNALELNNQNTPCQ
jgi:DNA (cytosine-5)-methyltransferase 1